MNLADNTFLDNAGGGGPFTVFGQVAGDGMTLFNAFNTLSITNLNPDTNHNGVRDDPGPFFNYSAPTDTNGLPTDGVPYLHGTNSDLLVILERATQINYLGAGSVTDTGIGGISFDSRDAFIDTGTSFIGTGGITIANGHTLGIREGFSLGRDLTNHGVVAPGLQLGSVTVQNYSQFTDGTLAIQLAAATPTGSQYSDTQYDRLVATGIAALGGKLSVSFLNGFNPVANNSFTVVSASSILGIFNTFDLPQLSAWFGMESRSDEYRLYAHGGRSRL